MCNFLFLLLLLQSTLAAGPSAESPVSLTIAALSVTPDPWDKKANYARLERYAREAAARGANLVVTPEGFLEGYVAHVRNQDLTKEKYAAVAEALDGPSLTKVRDLARELKVYLLIGFAERRDGQFYNSAAIFSPEGKVILHYSKAHNADDEPFNTRGAEFPVAATPLGRWGALICYDRQLPETSRILAVKGAQLILVPAWGEHGEMNDVMMRTRAYENSVYVAFVHPKRSLIIDPRGKILAQNQGEGDQLVMARIVLDDRIGKGPIRSRRPEIYRELLK